MREAIGRVRDEGVPLEVRATWEGGDAGRYADEARRDSIDVVIAGGGDGTVNEVVNGLFRAGDFPSVALGILPLGTANDFARSCGLPLEPYEALKFALGSEPVHIDVAPGPTTAIF